MVLRWGMAVGIVAWVACAGCEQILGIQDVGGHGGGDQADGGTPHQPDGHPADGTGSACGSTVPDFPTPTNYAVGSGAAVAAGQLDGDGRVDVVVVTLGDVLIFPGNGDGTLGAVRPLHAGSATIANGVLVADLDHDGHDDILTYDGANAVLGTSGTGIIAFHRQDPTTPGTFEAPQTLTVSGLAGVLLGNFDGDMRPDLLVVSSQSGVTPYFASTTTFGSYTAGTQITTVQTLGAPALVADIDGDGYDDIAFVMGGASATFEYNTPASPGTFVKLQVGGTTTQNVALGHYFTGDASLLDAVLIDAGESGSLYVQTQARDFTRQTAMAVNQVMTQPIMAPGQGLRSIDLDGDGRADVSSSGNFAIQCAALGTFYPDQSQPAQSFGDPLEDGKGSLLLVDLNADNKPEALLLDFNGGQGAPFLKVSVQ